MPDGKISIKVNFDSKEAKGSVKDLLKTTESSINNLKKQTKLVKVNYDVSQARASLKQLQNEIIQNEKNIQSAKAEYEKSIDGQVKALDREIANANKAYEKLKEGDLGDYERESDSALELKELQKARAKDQISLNAAEEVYNRKMDELEAKYAKVLQKADSLRSKMQELGQQKISLEANPESTPDFTKYQTRKTSYEDSINEAKSSIKDIVSEVENANSKALKFTSKFKALHSIASGVKNVVKGIGSVLGKGLGAAYSSAKKLAKTIGSKFISSIKKAASNFLHIGKNADSVHKKVLKIGTALLGMKGLMGGLKQIVSSAFSNNEKLQNTLESVKGVLGEAITPIINVIVEGLSKMVTLADRLYQIFSGTSLIAKYNANQSKKNAENTADAAKSAEEYKNQLAGFDAVNKLEDNNSDSSKDSDSNKSASLFQPTELGSGILQMLEKLKTAFNAGDFEGMGEALAAGLNGIIEKANSLDWDGIQKKVNGFSKGLAKAVNGFTKDFDWYGAGTLFSNGLNTITGAVSTFVDNTKWDSIGAGIATSLNGIVDNIDTEALGKTLTAKWKILTDTLDGFLNGDGKKKGFDFKNFGKKIGETINSGLKNIDFKKVGSNITGAISGFGETVYGAVTKINWNNGSGSVVSKIEDFIKGLDWKTAFTNIFKALGATLGGMGSVIIQFLKDAWNSVYDKYFAPAIDEAGGNVVEGIFNGIINWIKDIGKWIDENILTPFVDGFKETFNIHSPSTNPQIVELGKNIIEGAFNGIIQWLQNIKTWFQENVFSKIIDAWSGLKELTISIGGKLEESFNTAKENWENFKSKTETLTAEAKEKVQNALYELQKKWDNFKTKTETLTAQAKEDAAKTFSDLKGKWDGLVSKTEILTAQAQEDVHNTFSDLKGKWDGFVTKTEILTAETIQNAFDSLKSAWDNWSANKTVEMIANTVQTAFDSLKTSWDNWKNKDVNFTANTIRSAFDNLKRTWDNWKKKDVNFTANTIQSTFDSLKSAWDKWRKKDVDFAVNTLADAFYKFKDAWEALEDKTINLWAKITGSDDSGSSVSVGGEAKKSIFSSIFSSLFGLKLASGGIVNRPPRGVPAIVGEAGSEAVLPLENNTEWMDTLAKKTAEVVLSNFNGLTLINQMDSTQLSKEFVSINNRRKLSKNGGGY